MGAEKFGAKAEKEKGNWQGPKKGCLVTSGEFNFVKTELKGEMKGNLVAR